MMTTMSMLEWNATMLSLPDNTTGNITKKVLDRHAWPDFMRIFCPMALAVDKSLTPIIYIIGICGNTLAAKIWTEKRMRSNNSSAVYLSILSITDLIFLLLYILQELKYTWGYKTLSYHGICETYFLFSMAAQYLSPLLVLGFTVERYIAVCHPFQKEKFCTTSRAIRVVIGLVFLSISLSSIQAWFWTLSEGVCTIRMEALIKPIWEVWTWSTEMLIFLVVPLVILVFNILVIKEVRRMSSSGQIALPGQVKNHKGSSRATTVMLLSVSFYVIFTTLPATVVYAMGENFQPRDDKEIMTDEEVFADSVWYSYRVYLTGRKIVEEICLSHYACNFFLYLITGEHFRKCFLDIIRCKSYKSHGLKSNGNYSEISQSQKTWQQNHLTHLSRL